MNIILASATSDEIAPVLRWMDEAYHALDKGGFKLHEQLSVYPLITGVGMLPATYALTRTIARLRPDLIIQAGLGGALNQRLSTGEVVHVISERIADLGAEDRDGSFLSVFDLGLADPNAPPFRGGTMHQTNASEFEFLPDARGITVNKAHGAEDSIEQLKTRVDADVESQEGAALFYTCLMEETPFLELRAISNYVEPRDREGWQIEKALNELNDCLKQMIPLFTPDQSGMLFQSPVHQPDDD